MGKGFYSGANELLICSDSGGSNGYRVKLWKIELQRFSNESRAKNNDMPFAPGTSKWNKIEHRLFSHISMNWRGRPLVSHDVIVNLIASTTTKSGLRVKAELDKTKYPVSVKVLDEEMSKLQIKPHKFHGEWNYTIMPEGNCL